MVRITDWLDDQIREIIKAPGRHERKADFREEARTLVEQAEQASFAIANMKEACGGDV